jgi:choline dehydrogenase-like flavoprotein
MHLNLNAEFEFTRSKCFNLDAGGSSNLNAMIYQRGNPNDYNNWARITGNSEWAYGNLLKVFRGLEDYRGAYPNRMPPYTNIFAMM